jgi:vacuolar protein sorting-associated protein 35
VQDDFHLHTLDSFLNATAQLQRNVNIKQIVISLIDRFANYAARVRDEDSISEGIL